MSLASIIVTFTDEIASGAELLGKPVVLIASFHFASLANGGGYG